MPLYEYECPKCGAFEAIRKFSDRPLSKCPTCGSRPKKLFSAPAFQFKGSGWYVTDYARKGKPGGKPEGEAEGKPEGKAEGKKKSSDEKAAKGAEAKAAGGKAGGGAASES